MPKDRIYQKPRSPVPPFAFDDQVAGVFDDMLQRSIPLYREIIKYQVQLIRRFYRPGTRIYDLGCSNGNLGLAFCRRTTGQPFEMVAVDNSASMLRAYARRLAPMARTGGIRLLCRDICDIPIENASVVVLNFTLQFLPPDERDAMIERIIQGLVPGGILLLSEKITHSHHAMAELEQAFYHDFKKEHGYSDLEISQKREALEKVLVPDSLGRHLRRLDSVGFESIEVWLKWFNFAALVALTPGSR